MDTQETLKNMAAAAYEYHRGVAQLARGANDKPADEIQSGLDEALAALDAMRDSVVALKEAIATDVKPEASSAAAG